MRLDGLRTEQVSFAESIESDKLTSGSARLEFRPIPLNRRGLLLLGRADSDLVSFNRRPYSIG